MIQTWGCDRPQTKFVIFCKCIIDMKNWFSFNLIIYRCSDYTIPHFNYIFTGIDRLYYTTFQLYIFFDYNYFFNKHSVTSFCMFQREWSSWLFSHISSSFPNKIAEFCATPLKDFRAVSLHIWHLAYFAHAHFLCVDIKSVSKGEVTRLITPFRTENASIQQYSF